jgi:hypothetical protein
MAIPCGRRPTTVRWTTFLAFRMRLPPASTLTAEEKPKPPPDSVTRGAGRPLPTAAPAVYQPLRPAVALRVRRRRAVARHLPA